jgi:hypothetical protein
MKIQGSVALVTGADRGLGQAYARELVSRETASQEQRPPPETPDGAGRRAKSGGLERGARSEAPRGGWDKGWQRRRGASFGGKPPPGQWPARYGSTIQARTSEYASPVM